MKQIRFLEKKVICGILILVFAVLPYLLVDIYVLPSADDLTNVWELGYRGGHNLVGVLNYVKNSYMSLQGVFFGKALESVISPIYNSFDAVGLNITLIVTLLLFSVTVLYLIQCITEFIFKRNRSITFLLSTLVIVLCLNGRVKRELLFWFTGACDYTLPAICGFWAIILLHITINSKDSKRQNWIYVALAVLLSFLAGGGSLQIAGYFCWTFLVILGMCILKKREIRNTAIVFGAALLGALINVAAPGNYARREGSYEKISLFKGGYYAAIAVCKELKFLFSSTYLPWILLIIIVIAFIYLEPVQIKKFNPFVIGLVVIGGWVISTFPVCYGYGNSMLADRGYEILEIYIVIGLYALAIGAVNWLKGIGIKLSKESIVIVLLLAIINIGYLPNVSITKIPSIQCVRQFISGDLKNYHDEWIDVLEEIQIEEAQVVEIPISQKSYSAEMVVMRPGLSENPENWVNQGIRALFEKEEVRLIVQDESLEIIENSKDDTEGN